MRLEQAIFTSVRSERLDGYQLAAKIGGVSEDLAKELTAWGPAHDSLWHGHPGATSVNFHGLSDDRFCVSQTTLSGAEYSGRGGGRVYTQMVVLPRGGMLKFTNVGGFDDRALLGKVVQVGPRKITGVIGARAIHLLKRAEFSKVVKMDAMRIDIGARNKDAAGSKVKVGDYAAFVTEYEELDEGRTAIGKAFDNRAGCAALIELLADCLCNEPRGDWRAVIMQDRH